MDTVEVLLSLTAGKDVDVRPKGNVLSATIKVVGFHAGSEPIPVRTAFVPGIISAHT